MSRSYESSGQQALLAVMEALAVRGIKGTTARQAAEAAGVSESAAFRALKNLELREWAEMVPGGGWRLTPRFCWHSERVRIDIHDQARLWLGEKT